MTDRPRKPASLDDLLKVNKEQFDKIFSAQMTEIDSAGHVGGSAVGEPGGRDADRGSRR